MLPNNKIRNCIKQVEESLNVMANNHLLHEIKDKTLETAAKMFVYLSFCPGTNLQQDLNVIPAIRNKSSKEIIISLSNVLKTSSNNVKNFTEKVWIKMSSLLELQNINIYAMNNKFTNSTAIYKKLGL